MSSELRVNKLTSRSGVGTVTFNDSGLIITGIATAATLDITGNATIAGVLSYDDVTNVDSVGIVTAAGGVDTNTIRGKTNNSNMAIGARASNGAFVHTLTITPGRDVGIGDAAPDSNYGSNLSVHSTATDGARLKLSDGSTGKTNSDGLDIISTGSVAYFINRENADMVFYTNNTERVRIDNSGHIGINRTNPGGVLDILGSGDDLVRFQSASGAITQRLVSADGSLAKLEFTDSSAYRGKIQAEIDDSITFYTGGVGSERVRITSAGHVNVLGGILNLGTADSSSGHINSFENMSFNIDTDNDDTSRYFSFHANSANASGTELVRITSAGNFGIGTTPNVKLQVKLDTNKHLYFQGNIGEIGNVPGIQGVTDAGASASLGLRGNDLRFATGSAERMRIDGSGRLLLNGGTDVRMEFGTTGTTGTNDRNHIRGDGSNLKYNTCSGGLHIFEQNGIERLRIDSDGRLLVGTSTSPSGGDGHARNARLLVRGRVGVDADSGRLNLQRGSATSNGSSLGSISFTDNSNNIYARIESFADATTGTDDYPGRITFSTTADGEDSVTERMRITSSGRIGIGTLSPGSTLELSSAATSAAAGVTVTNTNAAGYSTVQFKNTGTSGRTYTLALGGSTSVFPGSFYLYDDTAGTSRFVVDSSGNVKIVSEHLRFNTSGKGIIFGTEGGSNRPSILGNYTSTSDNNIVFNVAGSEAMRIDGSSGRVLIGKTTTQISDAGTQLLPDGQTFSSIASSTSGVNTLHVYSTTASAYRFYVGMNGTINATNTTISAISDQRLKENIRDLDAGLAEILSLQPRRFDWKAGKGKDIQNDQGFIAQEFEQVFPEMVDEWIDPAPDGEDPYKAVRADLIPVLVKALQETHAKIEALEAKVAALEAG